jgi:hypothetical protein
MVLLWGWADYADAVSRCVFLARMTEIVISPRVECMGSRFWPLLMGMIQRTYSLGVGGFDRGDDRGHRIDDHEERSGSRFRI